jgi:hypothetical protein
MSRGGKWRNDRTDGQYRTVLLRQFGWSGPTIGVHAQLALQVRLGTTQALVLVEMRGLRKSGAEHREHCYQRHQLAQAPAPQGAKWVGNIHGLNFKGSQRLLPSLRQ